MFDVPPINHGSVKVRIDGADWLADSSMLSGVPLPLTDAVFVSHGEAVGVEVEPVGESQFVWVEFPPLPEFVPCSLQLDPVDAALYHERYEWSREMSPFNERLYLRKVTPDGLIVLLGHTRFRKTPDGLEAEDLSRDGLCGALHDAGLRRADRAVVGIGKPRRHVQLRRGRPSASGQRTTAVAALSGAPQPAR